MTVTELLQTTPSFVIDSQGNKTAVLLDFVTWQFVLTLLDGLQTELQVPRITQETAQLLAANGVSLEELLAGLEQEKQSLYEETYGAAAPTIS